MNRQYEFSGKCTKTGQWVYGNHLQRYDSFGPLSLIEVVDNEPPFNIEVYHVYPSSVGQFTGLKDKSGNKIYEGDIIRFAEIYLYIVKYEDAKFVGYHANNNWGKWGDIYKLAEPGFDKYDYAVIGNIHDNPELLNPASGITSSQHMTDPGTQQAEQEEVNATESAAQDSAMEAEEKE